uniref:Endonuclease III n=1 Tax=candidate division WOR-3 bacterium TaxID=2052148 RepID=A0A7C3N9P1_UNCW3
MDKKVFLKVVKILIKEIKKFKKPVVGKLFEKDDPYKILISTLISLRTKDKITEEVSLKLFNVADNPYSMAKLDYSDIERLIKKSGFYRNKAKVIKDVSQTLIDKFDGKVPDDMEKLMSLKGVGRKTANLVLSLGYGKKGICVDTHVHRISNRFGIVKTKNPYETEKELMKILPKKYWIIYNELLVTWGQNVCKPVNPKCKECVLNTLCDRVNVKK